jgi:hypothetical protein
MPSPSTGCLGIRNKGVNGRSMPSYAPAQRDWSSQFLSLYHSPHCAVTYAQKASDLLDP